MWVRRVTGLTLISIDAVRESQICSSFQTAETHTHQAHATQMETLRRGKKNRKKDETCQACGILSSKCQSQRIDFLISGGRKQTAAAEDKESFIKESRLH